MPSIDRRGKGWRARWRSPDGKSRSKEFDRKIDAQRFPASIEHSKQTGGYVDPSAGRVLFRDYAEEWRQSQPHRHATGIAVEHQLRLHVYRPLGRALSLRSDEARYRQWSSGSPERCHPRRWSLCMGGSWLYFEPP
jgi:hypothetical protein